MTGKIQVVSSEDDVRYSILLEDNKKEVAIRSGDATTELSWNGGYIKIRRSSSTSNRVFIYSSNNRVGSIIMQKTLGMLYFEVTLFNETYDVFPAFVDQDGFYLSVYDSKSSKQLAILKRGYMSTDFTFFSDRKMHAHIPIILSIFIDMCPSVCRRRGNFKNYFTDKFNEEFANKCG
jgi:hypothetical protein